MRTVVDEGAVVFVVVVGQHNDKTRIVVDLDGCTSSCDPYVVRSICMYVPSAFVYVQDSLVRMTIFARSFVLF
jgi:hypothetical protein